MPRLLIALINWNKHQSKVSIEIQNEYLDFEVNPNFQGVSWLFALSLEDDAHRASHTRYSLPAVEMKDYHVRIKGKYFFDHLLNNDLRTFMNTWKNYSWLRWWLHNRLFITLSSFQKIFQVNCNRFK